MEKVMYGPVQLYSHSCLTSAHNTQYKGRIWLLNSAESQRQRSYMFPKSWWQTLCISQGVVTYMSRVEAGSKLNQVIKAILWGRSRDQGDLQTAKNWQSRMHGCNVTFDLWKSSDQEPQEGTIKRSSTLFANSKTWLQSQTLLQATCDYPLISWAVAANLLTDAWQYIWHFLLYHLLAHGEQSLSM